MTGKKETKELKKEHVGNMSDSWLAKQQLLKHIVQVYCQTQEEMTGGTTMAEL